MQHFIMPFVNLTLEMAPYLLLGFLMAGLLHAFIPKELYNKHMGDRNLRSVITAATVGVPLPLCSCGVIPTAISLRKSGASSGATVSFLISTPQTGIDSILATGALMGWPMALLRPVIAFVTAIFGGQLVNRIAPSYNPTTGEIQPHSTSLRGLTAKLRETLRYGFIEMMDDIGKWLIIGLLIAGVITIIVPDNFLDGLQRWPLLNMLAMLVIALPMYVCATGSIPIAVALMMKGLSPGAALVFLMAGPATNIAAMMIIGKALNRRALIGYIASIMAGSIAFAMLIDYALPAQWFVLPHSVSSCHTDENFTLIQIASAIILVALLINSMVFRRHGCKHCRSNHHEPPKPDHCCCCKH